MTPFHAGWLALLVALAAGLLVRQERAGWLGTLWQLALAAGVIAWGGATLSTIAADRPPALELEALTLRPPPEGAVTLGTDAEVPLFDGHAASVHALVRWDEGAGDPVPTLWNASSTHRLLVDGLGIHDVPLTTRTTLELGRRTLEVAEGGLLPGLTLVDDRGAVHRLRAPLGKGLAALVPGIGKRIHGTLAWLQADGDGYRLLDHAPLPGTGPVATLSTRGTTPFLTFPSAGDRAQHPVVVDRPGEPASTAAERRTPLLGGEVVTLGHARYLARVDRGGVLELRSVGNPARMAWPTGGAVLDAGDGVLLAAEGDRLTLAALGADAGRGFRRLGGVLTETDGGEAVAHARPGDLLELPVGPGASARFRLVATPTPAAALSGLASAAERSVWTALAALAGLYLLVTFLAARLGLVHARTGGVLHGAALLLVVGLVCLVRLADPGDTLRAGWALRQSWLAVASFGVAALGLLGMSAHALLRRRRGLRPLRGDGFFRWLEGPTGDGSRARWLYGAAVVVLFLQLLLGGEAGIALPGLGSIQPIELARTLLVVYLSFWTARALEAKRASLRGPEGLAARWGYMAHALPILVVLGLCYALHDISPILVFGVFLAVFYALSLLRPSLRLHPQALRDHLAVDVLLVGLVLGAAGFLLLGDPTGTVARRIAVWWDPWSQTAEAYQSLTALWATASGGTWGLGWTGANGVLPPAVKDDFILALLAARGGAVAVTLVAGTFGVLLLAGAAGIEERERATSAADRGALLAGGMLWMLAIQAAVVLGSATGGLPVMGQPLPFVAAAGSHLVLFCLPAVATILGCTRIPVAAPAPARPRRPLRLPSFELPSMGPVTEGG